MRRLPLRILFLGSVAILAFSCYRFDSAVDGGNKSESIADIKKNLWHQTPPDPAVALRNVERFEVNKSVPTGRPVSFLVSDDNSLLLVDNINGKLFRISPDFGSAKEFGSTTL